MNKYLELDFGEDILRLIDHLVEQRDIRGLRYLHNINVEYILNHITDHTISIIDLNEYISLAIDELSKNTSVDEIKKHPLRKLIIDDQK